MSNGFREIRAAVAAAADRSGPGLCNGIECHWLRRIRASRFPRLWALSFSRLDSSRSHEFLGTAWRTVPRDAFKASGLLRRVVVSELSQTGRSRAAGAREADSGCLRAESKSEGRGAERS